jgi:replication-associated recombination protein RarA
MEEQAAAVEVLGTAIVARVPALLWGAPGTGKTSVIRGMADSAGWPCETGDRIDSRAIGLRGTSRCRQQRR